MTFAETHKHGLTAPSLSQYPALYKEYLALAAGLQSAEYGTFLDLLVFGVLELGHLEPLQPDVDLDGDGLERFEDTNPDDGVAAIDRCIDGDGAEILGADCVTDPRIQDGYSRTSWPSRASGKTSGRTLDGYSSYVAVTSVL